MDTIRVNIIGLAMAASAMFAGSAYAQVVDTYAWNGLCSDCSATGDTPASAVLAVQNYTVGSQLTAANFYSFSYQSNLFNLTLSALPAIAMGGDLPAVGSLVDTAMYVSGLFDASGANSGDVFSFTTYGDGSWVLALNGISQDEHGKKKDGKSNEFHESSHWNFDHRDDHGSGSSGGGFGDHSGGGDNGGCVSAIPEPETYAMMLAGLGLMGFVARRRKQIVAVA
jgi:hypothetical protein